MFDDDDPALLQLRTLALALPDAATKVSHGRPAFFAAPRGKVFAYYGGSRRVDGAWVQHPRCVVVLLEPGEREAVLDDPRSFVPAYLGPSGWVGLDLAAPGSPGWEEQWAEVAELVDASYRRTAGPRRVARLDAGERHEG